MERPLLKVTAASVAGECDDPEVAVGALRRIALDDFEACDRGSALGSHNL